MFKKFLMLFVGLSCITCGLESSPADLTGTRQSSGLLQPNNNQIHKNGAIANIINLPYVITWNITNNGGGNFSYRYDVTNTPLLPLSLLQDDFFIETGDVTAGALTNVTVNTNPVLFLPTNYEDTTVGGVSGIVFHMESIIGLIPTLGDFSLEFDVRSSPLWGDLSHQFVLDDIIPLTGSVTNADFGTSPPIGTNLPGYIATPGNILPVPEPPLYLLLGGLLLFVVLKMSGKKQVVGGDGYVKLQKK